MTVAIGDALLKKSVLTDPKLKSQILAAKPILQSQVIRALGRLFTALDAEPRLRDDSP